MTGTCDRVRENTRRLEGEMCLIGDMGGEIVQGLGFRRSLEHSLCFDFAP